MNHFEMSILRALLVRMTGAHEDPEPVLNFDKQFDSVV
jgi:hypothetical protein